MAQAEKTDKAAVAEPEKVKGKPGRPPKGTDRIPKVMGFFSRIGKIQKEDWGTRAGVRVYRLEPSVDRVRLGEPKHICVYSEPVDEERIKADHGSGRYRLYLNFKEPTEREAKEIDSVEIDILDTRFPPRLAPGEWIDHPHNNKWLWAKPLLTPINQQQPTGPGPTALGDMANTLRAFNEVQQSAREAMSANSPVDDLATVVTVAKELAALQKAPDNGGLMSEILKMNQAQLESVRVELAASRDRSDKLMMMLIESSKAKPAEQPTTNGMETVTKLVEGLGKLIPQIREVIPAEGTVRSRMSPWMEFFQPVLPTLGQAIMPLFAAMTSNAQGNPAPAANGAHPTITVQAQSQDRFKRLLTTLVDPALTYIEDGTSGADFAAFIFDGWGAGPLLAARKAGVEPIIMFFRTTESWPQIAKVETQFRQLLGDVLTWPIPGEEEPAATSATAPVIDLEATEAGN